MTLRSLKNQIDALKEETGGGEVTVIEITGGFSPKTLNRASIFDEGAPAEALNLARSGGETEEDFRTRAVAVAEADNKQFVVIGGLPSTTT